MKIALYLRSRRGWGWSPFFDIPDKGMKFALRWDSED